MAAIALDLTNFLLSALGIGTSVGFGEVNKDKQDEYTRKLKKLKTDVEEVGDLYDHTYYMVAVNHDRVLKAIDKLPDDFVEKVQDELAESLEDLKALSIACEVFNYGSAGAALVSGALQIVVKFRKYMAKRRLKNQKGGTAEEKPAPGEEIEMKNSKDPFDKVPVEESKESTGTTESEKAVIDSVGSRTTTLSKGIAIGGIVFGTLGIATALWMGISTMNSIDDAIAAVEKKQAQVDKYKEAMREVLNVIVKAAGLPPDSYAEIVKMAGRWKNVAENFNSYEKTMDLAIQGYYKEKPFDVIKKYVEEHSDRGKPFPEDGYTLAKTLADDIKYLVEQKKTDKEIVAFFANDNPKEGLRVVFDEYFISTLHSDW